MFTSIIFYGLLRVISLMRVNCYCCIILVYLSNRLIASERRSLLNSFLHGRPSFILVRPDHTLSNLYHGRLLS